MIRLLKAASLFCKLAGRARWGRKASGLMFVCMADKTVFLLQRSQESTDPGVWSITGGAMELPKIEDGNMGSNFYNTDRAEDPDPSDKDFLESAKRETQEEINELPPIHKIIAITNYKEGQFTYKTFVVDMKPMEKTLLEMAELNWEHSDAQWFKLSELPPNLHPGVTFSLQQAGLI